MATSSNAKIIMKNTTKMSLNERFTAYRAQAQSAANIYRQKIQMQRQVNSLNNRLAQQMANRPTVIAALRLKKRSLQQRLGRKQSANGNIKARLNMGGHRLDPKSIRGRLGTSRNLRTVRRGGLRPGTSPLLKARLGLPKSGGFNYGSSNQRIHLRNRRGNYRGNRAFREYNRQQQSQRKNIPRNPRGRGRGRARGRGRGRWTSQGIASLPTRQELDNQLDEYMAETKTSLDAQLGHYMSQG